MSKTKLLSGSVICRYLFVFIIILYPVNSSNAQDTEKEKAETKKAAALSFGVEGPKEAEEFFKEAKRLASNDPIVAIRLYHEGLILKPDAWQERKQIAVLYEKKQQWGLALAEYEVINKAAGSVESFTDLSRIFDKAGYPYAAAVTAREGFAKHPAQPHFLLFSGELFLKIGSQTEALAVLQEYMKLKPEDGKAFFLLGSIYEKMNKPLDALSAYLNAEKRMKNDADTTEALKRLRSGAASIEGLTIFLPPGWLPEKDGLVNILEGQKVVVSVKNTGDTAALALSAASKAMPDGLFDPENVQKHEKFKKMREEVAKTDPETAKMMEAIPTPMFLTSDMSGVKGAKKVLLSTAETAKPGMESAVAVAVPSSGKIYIFLWTAGRPAQDGEKILDALISLTVWPL